MYSKIMIDGNAVYEIDEECMKKRKEKEQEERKGVRPETEKKRGTPTMENG